MSADGPAPDEAQLERVGRRLRRGPVTRIEGRLERHRFFGPHEYLTVRWQPDGPAEWHAEADSPEALEGYATPSRTSCHWPRAARRRLGARAPSHA